MAGRDRALTRGPGRRAAAWALAAAVTAAHVWLLDQGAEFGWGDAGGADGAPPPVIEVAYVKDLAAAEPAPVVVPRTVAPARRAPARRRLVPPAAPASAVEPLAAASAVPSGASAPEALASAPAAATGPELAQAAEPAASAASAASPPQAQASAADVPQSVAAAAPAASAASAVAVEWPPSTRLSYRLNGNYRGELQGSASVEWRVSGTHYQVDLRAIVGVEIAPLMTRQIRSDGEITDDGLAPRRFDGVQRMGFSTRRWSVRFEPERIVTNDGPSPAPPGVQDEASQFVQLTWLFTTRPQLLQVGRSVELPLVLRRRVDRWVYEVVSEQETELPFARVKTLHVKPRRPARGGDMTAEMWIAPTLQNLPVRILIRQDQDNFVDLLLDSPPRQAERAAQGVSDPAPR